MNRTRPLGIILCAALFLGSSPALAFQFGVAPNPSLAVDSHGAGVSPAHRLSFDIQAGELEVYRATITYPRGFRFNGFDALGPAHSPVGALLVDLNVDGVADTAIPLRSLSPSSAYADVIPDGKFTPSVEPMLGAGGRTELTLVLPFGGDANRATVTAARAARMTVLLFAGLLTNPDRGGAQTIRAELTSVDPETDGPDDGRNASPLTLAFAVSVDIEGPGHAPPPLFLRGSGGLANPSTLFLDERGPTAPAPRFRESSALRFSGGNLWREIGTWATATGTVEGQIVDPTPLRLWIGLRNSDDQGTQFDLRADVEKNGEVVATGVSRCITGVTRNPDRATAVAVSIASVSGVDFDGDVLRLRIFARIGTNPDGSACPGPGGSHTSASGVRLYFDSIGRPAVLGAQP